MVLASKAVDFSFQLFIFSENCITLVNGVLEMVERTGLLAEIKSTEEREKKKKKHHNVIKVFVPLPPQIGRDLHILG